MILEFLSHKMLLIGKKTKREKRLKVPYRGKGFVRTGDWVKTPFDPQEVRKGSRDLSFKR